AEQKTQSDPSPIQVKVQITVVRRMQSRCLHGVSYGLSAFSSPKVVETSAEEGVHSRVGQNVPPDFRSTRKCQVASKRFNQRRHGRAELLREEQEKRDG